ncbi:hypothetical protein EHP00_87 [Ecytonucleospora hepatopenaei]|uniref:Uncharacterized protein n=1 Tax=Ecytonucleospora hepatopenaei TaxID=646526 RepID=A0A1W0E5W9_9MICR|nr:hypothetical protein EHP00_87 [Ecytonucleospora hepatopenaei]
MQSSKNRVNEAIYNDNSKKENIKLKLFIPKTIQFIIKKYSNKILERFSSGKTCLKDMYSDEYRYQKHINCTHQVKQEIFFNRFNKHNIDSLCVSNCNIFCLNNVEGITIKKLVLYKCTISFKKLYKLLSSIKIYKCVFYSVDFTDLNDIERYPFVDFGVKEIVFCKSSLKEQTAIYLCKGLISFSFYGLNDIEFAYDGSCNGYKTVICNAFYAFPETKKLVDKCEVLKIKTNNCQITSKNLLRNVKFIILSDRDINDKTLDFISGKVVVLKFINCRFHTETMHFMLSDTRKFENLRKIEILGNKTYLPENTKQFFLKHSKNLSVKINTKIRI